MAENIGSMLSMPQFTTVKPPSPAGRPLQSDDDVDGPLPLGKSTATSSGRAAAWRKPRNRVLPYQTGTSQTLFQPFGP